MSNRIHSDLDELTRAASRRGGLLALMAGIVYPDRALLSERSPRALVRGLSGSPERGTRASARAVRLARLARVCRGRAAQSEAGVVSYARRRSWGKRRVQIAELVRGRPGGAG